MGTDITLFAEKRRPDGSWEEIPVEYDGRNYSLFARLAGVRGDTAVHPPLREPRLAFPEDNSAGWSLAPIEKVGFGGCLYTERNFRWDNSFGYSWLTLAELEEEEHWDFYSQKFRMDVVDVMREHSESPARDDVRILFYFD